MSTQLIQNAYKRYSNYYDCVFGRLLQPGRLLASKLINNHTPPSAKILEVGVGTGLSLPLYRPDLEIIGIDISHAMLNKAHMRLADPKLRARTQLLEMNVEKLSFPDKTFKAVAAMYVASVVSNLEVFLEEITRVCEPGGDIFIVNHFSSENPVVHMFEKQLAPFHSTLGFRSVFPMDPLLKYPHLELIKIYKTNLFGYWKVLHFKRCDSSN